MSLIKAIALIGATATGKTAASLNLAESVGAEIISVDSRQVYKHMDVGTAKVTPAERARVPHHLIDVVEPNESFSVADFVAQAVSAAEKITKHNHVPLFVGGTPFYYHALFDASLNADLPSDERVRKRLELDDAAALHERLACVDPVTAARLHVNDKVRVVRALEIYELTGQAPAEIYATGEKLNAGLRVRYLGLNLERQLLRERIARRLREQFDAGFVEEVAWLIAHGYDERCKPMNGLGYRELARNYRGELDINQAFELALNRTRQFAKRQLTWFKKFDALWFDACALDLSDELARAALAFLESEMN